MSKTRPAVLLTIVFLIAALPTHANPAQSRSFIFNYNITITDIKPGAGELKVWIPYPAETAYQTVEDFKINTDASYFLTQDKEYGNKMLCCSIKPLQNQNRSVNIKMQYKVKREEFSNKPGDNPALKEFPALIDKEKYLAPSRLVTISPRIKKIAREIVKDKKTTVEKAKAIYDYVITNVEYDKSSPGWGNGDTERVCDVKKGNCTDFHSLFISLARASGIPARFVIGFPIPEGASGEVEGYHCWAEFYADGFGWIPVDASEAWKDRSKYDYLFGTIDENRIEFTNGRDIPIAGAHGEKLLNYFIYPYAELDGEPFERIDLSFSVQDIPK